MQYYVLVIDNNKPMLEESRILWNEYNIDSMSFS